MKTAPLDKAEHEYIVLVNEQGKPIGQAPKLASHHAHTPLHLAFSVYIFNATGKLLVTQRATNKKVWPRVWTNSCCGHPAPNESIQDAITRRVTYELGMSLSNLRVVLPDYRYQTPPFEGIIENEICPVFFANTSDEPKPNPLEVEAYQWLSWHEFCSQAQKDTNNMWSWWCKDQLKQLVSTPELFRS